MEFLGHQKAFAFLLGTGIIIKSFISDRHQSIAKWMREDCPRKCRELGKPVIDHFFDLWHIGKSKGSNYCFLNSNIIQIVIVNNLRAPMSFLWLSGRASKPAIRTFF